MTTKNKVMMMLLLVLVVSCTKQVRPIETELKGFGDAFFKALDGNFIERR